MGSFVYNDLPPDAPTDSDTFWQRRAQERNLAMAAKREANGPVNIPSLSQLYRDNDQVHDAQAAERQAEIAAGEYAWHGEGLPLPRNDPKAIEARNKVINGE